MTYLRQYIAAITVHLSCLRLACEKRWYRAEIDWPEHHCCPASLASASRDRHGASALRVVKPYYVA